jgi:hypothetical protein
MIADHTFRDLCADHATLSSKCVVSLGPFGADGTHREVGLLAVFVKTFGVDVSEGDVSVHALLRGGALLAG